MDETIPPTPATPKLHKKEPISFKDVDKLNEEEKNQLYMIGKRLHVRKRIIRYTQHYKIK